MPRAAPPPPVVVLGPSAPLGGQLVRQRSRVRRGRSWRASSGASLRRMESRRRVGVSLHERANLQRRGAPAVSQGQPQPWRLPWRRQAEVGVAGGVAAIRQLSQLALFCRPPGTRVCEAEGSRRPACGRCVAVQQVQAAACSGAMLTVYRAALRRRIVAPGRRPGQGLLGPPASAGAACTPLW